MALFRKAATAGAGAESANPYLAARREWNDHVGDMAASRRMWQLVALASLLITLSAVGGVIAIGLQSKFVPYVVKVNELGDAVAVSRADMATPVDQRVVEAQVARFVLQSRSVTSDPEVEKQYVYGVFSMLRSGDPASSKMKEWWGAKPESSPFVRAQTSTVEVQIASVVALSDKSYQVDWVETTQARDGSASVAIPSVKMRGVVQTVTQAPSPSTTEKEIRDNPTGLYVTDFSWSQITS